MGWRGLNGLRGDGAVAEGFRRDRRSLLERTFRYRQAELRVAGKVGAGFLGFRTRIACHGNLLEQLQGQCQRRERVPPSCCDELDTPPKPWRIVRKSGYRFSAPNDSPL